MPTPRPKSQEIVLFCGYPSLGKSSFYKKHFQPAGYVHVNQDTLGTRQKCIKAVEETLQAGDSCVVGTFRCFAVGQYLLTVLLDNTNRDKQTRAYYIDLAQRLKVPIRCIHFQGSFELAWHNNLYRAFNLPSSVLQREVSRIWSLVALLHGLSPLRQNVKYFPTPRSITIRPTMKRHISQKVLLRSGKSTGCLRVLMKSVGDGACGCSLTGSKQDCRTKSIFAVTR